MANPIEYYMNLSYDVSVKKDTVEGGYVVWIPDLPGCITCCEKIEEIENQINDAKYCWLSAELEKGNELPVPKHVEDYSGQFKLRIPKSLHKRLADCAKTEGVSLNQYCVYMLSR